MYKSIHVKTVKDYVPNNNILAYGADSLRGKTHKHKWIKKKPPDKNK